MIFGLFDLDVELDEFAGVLLANPFLNFFPNTNSHFAAVIRFTLRYQPVIVV